MLGRSKTFWYGWSRDKWILTVQVHRLDPSVDEISFVRLFKPGCDRDDECEIVKLSGDSHRFMISRRHRDEVAVRLLFDPEKVEVRVYEVKDRAYYAGQAFFVSRPLTAVAAG